MLCGFLLNTAMFFLRPHGISLKHRKIDLVFMIFIGFSLLGADITAYPQVFFQELITIVYLFCLMRTISGYISTVEDASTAVRYFSIFFIPLLMILNTVFILRGLGFAHLTTTFFSFARKLNWPYDFPNQLAAYMLCAFPLVFIFKFVRSIFRFFIYFGFLVVLGGIASRSGLFIGLGEIIAVELVLAPSLSHLNKYVSLATIGCGIVTIGFILTQEWTFLRAIGAIENLPITFDTARYMQLLKLLDLLPYWITGLGLGCFKMAYAGRIIHDEVHNVILSLLVESGIGGLFAMAWIFVLSLAPTWKLFISGIETERLLAKCLIIAVFGLLCFGMFQNLLRNRFLWMLLGLSAHLRSTPRLKPQKAIGNDTT